MSRKKNPFSHPRCLTIKQIGEPILPNEEDESSCLGIFYHNITAMQEWLEQNPQPVIDMPIGIWEQYASDDDQFIDNADISRPIIVAEIAPDCKDFIPDIQADDWIRRGYVCIDGYHRIKKARRLGLETLPAVVLRMEQHFPFLYSGCEQYVEYWNGKLEDRTIDSQIWERNK